MFTSIQRSIQRSMHWLLLSMLCILYTGCAYWAGKVDNRTPDAAHLIQAATDLEEKGETVQAIRILTQVANLDPDDTATQLRLTNLLIQKGDQQAAMKQLRSAIERSPSDPLRRIKLAELQLGNHQLQSAQRTINSALEITPDNNEALLLKAQIEEQQGQHSQAMSTYLRVLSQVPDNSEALLHTAKLHMREGDCRLAAPLLRSHSANDFDGQTRLAESLWLLGNSYGREHRWADAIKAMTSALPYKTDIKAEDWYKLAYAQYQYGDYEAANQSIDQLLENSPHDPAGHILASQLRTNNQSVILKVGHSLLDIPVPKGW